MFLSFSHLYQRLSSKSTQYFSLSLHWVFALIYMPFSLLFYSLCFRVQWTHHYPFRVNLEMHYFHSAIIKAITATFDIQWQHILAQCLDFPPPNICLACVNVCMLPWIRGAGNWVDRGAEREASVQEVWQLFISPFSPLAWPPSFTYSTAQSLPSLFHFYFQWTEALHTGNTACIASFHWKQKQHGTGRLCTAHLDGKEKRGRERGFPNCLPLPTWCFASTEWVGSNVELRQLLFFFPVFPLAVLEREEGYRYYVPLLE